LLPYCASHAALAYLRPGGRPALVVVPTKVAA
jgi:hypothetical protein